MMTTAEWMTHDPIYIPDNESDPFIYLMDSVSLNGCPLTDTEVTAEQYLQFAARDLEDESDRGAVNGIGNAKRALHQTVDALLQAYGLLARNRRASFPQKLELIDKAGLFSLAILNTLNLERNAVEHEYRVPTHARCRGHRRSPALAAGHAASQRIRGLRVPGRLAK